MITNNGKEIISKYLLSQVPSYATHLSIGCGATPLGVNDSIPNSIYAKDIMDFEMTRVPISSKGFVDNSATYLITKKYLISNVATLTTSVAHDIIPGETVIISNVDSSLDGQYIITATNAPTNTTFSYAKTTTNISPEVALSPPGSAIVSRTKISLTAELPTDNRYEITEVGVWSAGSNNLASSYESRILFNFTQSWQLHNTAISDPQLNTNLGYNGTSTTVDIQDPNIAFYANTSDPIFQVNTRKDRKEGPRHLNRTLLVRGDLSSISYASGGGIDSDWTAEGTHIHLNDISMNISGNNSGDLFKLAMSMIDKTAIDVAAVKDVKVLIEFYKTEVNTTSGYAKAQIYIPGSVLDENRYFVSTFAISQNIDYSNESALTTLPYARFYTSPDFSSSQVRIARVFVSVTKTDDSLSQDHYLCFDGFRIENTTENPIYKMSGYSLIKNDGYPIIKLSNSNNYVDFRFSLGVS